MAHPTRHRVTILLVEDDPDVQDLLVAVLRRGGHEVLPAADPPEALAAARAASERGQAIDVLVSDVFLPGMSGYALARETVARFPKIRVVFVSGYPDPDPPPGITVLRKPFAPNTLLTLIEDALDSSYLS